jgi:hypothetical protein
MAIFHAGFRFIIGSVFKSSLKRFIGVFSKSAPSGLASGSKRAFKACGPEVEDAADGSGAGDTARFFAGAR